MSLGTHACFMDAFSQVEKMLISHLTVFLVLFYV